MSRLSRANRQSRTSISADIRRSHQGIARASHFSVARALIVILVAASSCFTASCGASDASSEAARERVLVVTRGDLHDVVLLTGKLSAVNSQTLKTPPTSVGRLSIRYLADDGARVKKGDVVLQFDTADLASRVEERKLEALEAENRLIREKSNNRAMEADKAFAVVDTDIVLQKGAISAEVPANILPEREYQERQLLVERTSVQLAKVKDALTAHQKGSSLAMDIEHIALEKTKREIAAAERELASLSLTAPSDGILIVMDHPWEARKFIVGDSIWPGFPIVELPDLSVMEVKARLSDVDDGRIVKGMSGECVLDAFADRSFPCRVEELSPVAQSETRESMRRGFAVKLSLESTDAEHMRPGMSVKVQVQARTARDVLRAPLAGLDVAGGRAYLQGGGEAEVTIDWCNRQMCIIEDGLSEGARLRAGGGR